MTVLMMLVMLEPHAAYLNKLMVRQERHLLMCREIEEDCCQKSFLRHFVVAPSLSPASVVPSHPPSHLFQSSLVSKSDMSHSLQLFLQCLQFLCKQSFYLQIQKQTEASWPATFSHTESSSPSSAKDSPSMLILVIVNNFLKIVNTQNFTIEIVNLLHTVFSSIYIFSVMCCQC